MKYQAVIFDLFGTIVNIFSRPDYEKALEEMILILKAPHDEFVKLWYQTAGERAIGTFGTLEDNLKYICRQLKITPSENQFKRASQVRMEMVARALTPKKDAIETIRQLKSSGYKTGLISNCSPEPPVLWPGTPFAPLFDATIFSSTCGLRKPEPPIYKLALQKLAVKAESCLYIGDGDGNELDGAAQVGMRPVLIRDPGEDSRNVIRDNYQGEDWEGPVITSLKEVLRFLE
jgi:putative hydrolase of the HAD superfamily